MTSKIWLEFIVVIKFVFLQVISSIGALSIPFGNKVHHYKEYEVLVRT